MRTIKNKGSFSEDFSLKKGGHFVRLSILVQNSILQLDNHSFQTNIRYILRGGHLLVKTGVIQ